MKNLFLILSLNLTLTAFAQRLIPPIPHAQDSVINKRDSLGRKTGLWVKYYYDNGDHRRIINTGHYNAGKKIGIWKYYENEGCFVCLDTAKCRPLTEIYEADGSVTIIGQHTLHINSDSSSISYIETNRWKEYCKKNSNGGYDCIRVYNEKTMKTVKKTFESFDSYYWNGIGTKW